MIRQISICFLVLGFFTLIACEEKVEAVFDNTPYEINYGMLVPPDLPADNPLTNEGVKLGKMLFYEKALSRDLSQSCADCHVQEDGFSDERQFSLGIKGLPGGRQAMAIFNLGFHKRGFFWDGRAETLREQALMPIQDPLEMDNTLENMVNTLNADEMYQDQFVRAFEDGEITAHNVSLALEQFMFSIVSSNSKYDRYLAGITTLTPQEFRGLMLFKTEYNPFDPGTSGAHCEHCHGGSNFENDAYMNNGLDYEITDQGYELTTGNEIDKGKFKVPTLRNIALTAPYMHDGRFNTLEEVLLHYNEGVKTSETLDGSLIDVANHGLSLTESDIQDLVAFLHTLTDVSLTNNEAYKSPF